MSGATVLDANDHYGWYGTIVLGIMLQSICRREIDKGKHLMTSPTGSSSDSGNAPGAQQVETAEKKHTSDFSHRAVALVLDVSVAYFVAIMVSFIFGIICAPFPIVKNVLSFTTIMVLYLLVRDYLFEGRGVGKNLVGLQVVDSRFRRPATLTQSVMRNVSWLAPFIVLAIAQDLALVIPYAWLNQVTLEAVHILGAVYCMIMFPLEAYRTYYRIDGLRLGDELAGTLVVEAHMDFSQVVPKQ